MLDFFKSLLRCPTLYECEAWNSSHVACFVRSQMCSSYPSGISRTSNPQAGDVVVFSWGTYGHTAIITSVGSGSINVIEQNASPTGINIAVMIDLVQMISIIARVLVRIPLTTILLFLVI